jgi:hypothetical protein
MAMSEETFFEIAGELPANAPGQSWDAPAIKRRGRRPLHTEHWTKVTVVLMDRQIVFLDRLVAEIRAGSGAVLSRANIIRGLVDALAESDLDLTGIGSERALTAFLTEQLRASRAVQTSLTSK